MPVRIAIDAMGGDAAPGINTRGALQALASDADLHCILVGPRETVAESLRQAGAKESDRLSILHSDEIISMEDHAATVARRKRESSIHVGMRLVKEKKADAFFPPAIAAP